MTRLPGRLMVAYECFQEPRVIEAHIVFDALAAIRVAMAKLPMEETKDLRETVSSIVTMLHEKAAPVTHLGDCGFEGDMEAYASNGRIEGECPWCEHVFVREDAP